MWRTAAAIELSNVPRNAEWSLKSKMLRGISWKIVQIDWFHAEMDAAKNYLYQNFQNIRIAIA